jgi:hypothetical protein
MKPSPVSKDVRELDVKDVVTLSEWLTKYRHLENSEITDSKQLLDVLVRSSREYEGDFGVFTPND